MIDNNNHPHTKNWATAFTFIFLLLIFLVVNIRMVAPYMLSVSMGGILALLFFPYYSRLRARHFTQFWAALTVTLGVVLIIVIPIAQFTFVATKQATTIAGTITKENHLTLSTITERLEKLKIARPILNNNEKLKAGITENIQKVLEGTTKAIFGIVGSIPDMLLQLVLGMLACFYFLIDGRRFLLFLNDKIPLDGDVRLKLYGSFKDSAISVIWATFAAAGAQALIMFLSFLFMGIPGAFLAGGATFIFAWIPFIGSIPVWGAGAVYLYVHDQIGLMFVMLSLGGFTGIIDNYIRAWILKGRNELHPLIGLVSIFGGIAMFGVFGVFFGPVFAATLIALLQIWPTVGKRFGLTFESPVEVTLEERKTD